MALKVVMFYNMDEQGWTETFYAQGSNPAGFIDFVNGTNLSPLIKFRADGCTLYAIRASIVGQPRNSYSTLFGSSYSNSQFLPPFNPPDITAISALLKITSATNKVRHLWLRGLRYADVLRDEVGNSTPSAALTLAMANYFAFVQGTLGAQIQYLQQPPAGGSVWTNVPNVQAETDIGYESFSRCAVLLPTTFNLGVDQVVFRGIPKDALPGFPRVCAPASNAQVGKLYFDIPYTYRAYSDVTSTPKLQFVLQTLLYSNWDSFAFEVFDERKTGRPFGVPRGRTRAVVLRH